MKTLPEFPKEKKSEFDTNYPYCSSCGLSEDFCKCNGFDTALSLCKSISEQREGILKEEIEKLRGALNKIEDTLAQPLDRIAQVDLFSYGDIRKRVLDLIQQALRGE